MTSGGATDDILAIDANNGKQMWHFETQECINSIAVMNGLVYVVTDRDRLFALGADTGREEWSFNEAMYISHLNIIGTAEMDTWEKTTEADEPFGGPVIVGDSVYISHGTGLYCLDSKSGRKKWSLGTYNDAITPVVNQDTIYLHDYVTVGREPIAAIDAQSGQRLWQFPFYSSVTNLIVADNILLVYTGDAIHALNPDTGKPAWYALFESDIRTTSEVVDGTVCIATEDHVHAIRYAFPDHDRLVWSSGAHMREKEDEHVANSDCCTCGLFDWRAYCECDGNKCPDSRSCRRCCGILHCLSNIWWTERTRR
jgi:outer membrane protein assembly factor BamB